MATAVGDSSSRVKLRSILAAQKAGAEARLQPQPSVRVRHDVDGWEFGERGREADVGAARTARRVEAENARPAHNASSVIDPWPAHKEVRGVLSLRLRPDQTEGLAALCSIKHDLFTICVESRKGSGFGHCNHLEGLELAKIEITKLVLILRPEQKDGFSVGYEGHQEVEIFCQARDNTARNKWVSVFRRLGVLVCAHLGESHRTPSRPQDECNRVVVYPRKALVRSGPMVHTTTLNRSGTW